MHTLSAEDRRIRAAMAAITVGDVFGYSIYDEEAGE